MSAEAHPSPLAAAPMLLEPPGALMDIKSNRVDNKLFEQ